MIFDKHLINILVNAQTLIERLESLPAGVKHSWFEDNTELHTTCSTLEYMCKQALFNFENFVNKFVIETWDNEVLRYGTVINSKMQMTTLQISNVFSYGLH